MAVPCTARYSRFIFQTYFVFTSKLCSVSVSTYCKCSLSCQCSWTETMSPRGVTWRLARISVDHDHTVHCYRYIWLFIRVRTYVRVVFIWTYDARMRGGGVLQSQHAYCRAARGGGDSHSLLRRDNFTTWIIIIMVPSQLNYHCLMFKSVWLESHTILMTLIVQCVSVIPLFNLKRMFLGEIGNLS